MSDSTALVLSDSRVLQQICGANDQNIRYLESLFDAHVLVRGNEVLLDSPDHTEQQIFLSLMEELEAYTRRGHLPDHSLITALHESLRGDDEAPVSALRDVSIDVPLGGRRVFPRTSRQARALQALDRYELNLFIGPAGTGKTFLAVAHALREVLSKRKRKLVLTRPVVEAGESLGFLPGDLTQKVSPYLRPLYDAIESLVPYEVVKRMEEQRIIEIAPLAYMRGRSLTDAYVILDEAQNTTREQMKMFLTRLGERTHAVVTGDITQIDLPRRVPSGLVHAVQVLEAVQEIGRTHFTREDVVRSQLVRRIIKAYDEYDDAQK